MAVSDFRPLRDDEVAHRCVRDEPLAQPARRPHDPRSIAPTAGGERGRYTRPQHPAGRTRMTSLTSHGKIV
jgi:hypothetical protein